ncbi:uncharacterized protein LOC119670275 [Teleopsis dalmanni]|uniref:uncharacterized protein LOC119670275 n=1 Tax=Teleopsis dalmanni TaxID=139649 RepID=UPI0018CF6831|nr:uncharacterized protein LOC119670275 [Teleopsis dalmanni]
MFIVYENKDDFMMEFLQTTECSCNSDVNPNTEEEQNNLRDNVANVEKNTEQDIGNYIETILDDIQYEIDSVEIEEDANLSPAVAKCEEMNLLESLVKVYPMEIDRIAYLGLIVENNNNETLSKSPEHEISPVEIILTIINEAIGEDDAASTSCASEFANEFTEVASDAVTEPVTVVDVDNSTSCSSRELVFVPGTTGISFDNRRRTQSSLFFLRHPKFAWKRIQQAVRKAMNWIRNLRTGDETEV